MKDVHKENKEKDDNKPPLSDSESGKENLSSIEQNTASIFDNVIDYSIFIINRDRDILTWNKGAEKNFGYRPEEIIGQKVDTLFTPEDRKKNAPINEVETAYKEGRASDERWHMRKDGTRFYVSGVLTRLDGENNSPKFIKIARDLTDRKHNEEAIALADQRKNEFLATLAHELRNPLASIYSGLEILKLERDDASRLEIQHTIERQVMQIVHLVDDLLDISRITQGKIKLQKDYINIADAVQQAIETVRPVIESSKHKLTVSIPPEPIVVYADIMRLSQILLNILINAAKYTKPEGTIGVTASAENDKAILRIRDNGLGIPKHMLSKIFEMFTQIENSENRPQAGLGIGLSVVKQLVEMHEGTVEAFSEGENSGSEFVVALPRIPLENIPGGQHKVSHEESGSQQTSSLKPLHEEYGSQHDSSLKKRVLIIDDNRDAADMTYRLLKKRGYPVEVTYTGKTGLTKAVEFQPEVILLDIGLPDISGYEVAVTLRKRISKCYIIGISGWGQEEDRLRSQNAGFDHHLVKPVDIATIMTLLNSFP